MSAFSVTATFRLGEPAGATAGDIAGAWSVRIYIKPFIDWIWAGALLMGLGGFLAVMDRRYRLAPRHRPVSAPPSIVLGGRLIALELP
jgi:cytochrome c-type biogenesis protein CcmF